MRILGIDPGEDVGMSLLDTITKYDLSWQYNIKHLKDPHYHLYQVLTSLGPGVILCEDFYHLPRYMKLNMITVELIGVIKFYVQTHGVELHMQNRGMKQGWPNHKLKMLGLFQSGKDFEDAMDALRHRLVYQEKHGMINWSNLK